MLKRFVLWGLFVPLFIPACTSVPAPVIQSVPAPINPPAAVTEAIPSFLLSEPAVNALSFIGVASRRSDPKETIRFALEDAARRVAIFYRVSGEYTVEINTGSGIFDYSHAVNTSLEYDEEGYRQYVDSLQFDSGIDSMEMENTLIIRVKYPSALPVPLGYSPVRSGLDQKPDWVDRPPSLIENYEVGIGYAARHSTLTGTINASYENTIFAILRNLNAVSQSKDELYQGPGLFDYKTSNANVLHTRSSLKNFYVLDTWIDPATKAVWTLAIAQQGG